MPTNTYLLPSCFAIGDALGAEDNPARVGLERRDDRIIRSGTFADIEVVASWDADDSVVDGAGVAVARDASKGWELL